MPPLAADSKRPGGSIGRRDGLQGLSGWRIQWRVVDALVYRELRTRVSQVKGGFLGVLLQPLGLLAIWMVFLGALNLHRGGSLNIVLFLTSGIILFSIFSHVTTRSVNAMEANEALLFYRPVKPIDTVIARTLCEAGLYTSCYILILVGTWFYYDQVIMSDPGMFLFSLILAAALGFSTGLIFMVVGHIMPALTPVAIWTPRVLWFLSGVPFRYWVFPAWSRPFFVWNPLMHCIELNRRSLSDDYYTPDANLQYVIVWVIVQTTIALWIYSRNERRLLSL